MAQRPQSKNLPFYITPAHPCSYFPERQARTVFADPLSQKTCALYTKLSANGFRRSGGYIYRPGCDNCHACVPIRINVNEFRPNRAQRRAYKRNEDLTTTLEEPSYQEEHFLLYKRYIQSRHPGGGMETDDPKRYMEFLSAPWADTWFVEFRAQDTLLAVAVVDQLADGLSAVYTFFDPEVGQRGLGTYAILWEIEQCRRMNSARLYLGYWIGGCEKMQYKQDFRPQEYFLDNRWRHLD